MNPLIKRSSDIDKILNSYGSVLNNIEELIQIREETINQKSKEIDQNNEVLKFFLENKEKLMSQKAKQQMQRKTFQHNSLKKQV